MRSQRRAPRREPRIDMVLLLQRTVAMHTCMADMTTRIGHIRPLARGAAGRAAAYAPGRIEHNLSKFMCGFVYRSNDGLHATATLPRHPNPLTTARTRAAVPRLRVELTTPAWQDCHSSSQYQPSPFLSGLMAWQ